MVRKINSICALLVSLLTAFHGIYWACSALFRVPPIQVSYVVVGIAFGVHVLLAFSCNMIYREEGAAKLYPDQKTTIIQRLSGTLMIVLFAIHLLKALQIISAPNLLIVIFYVVLSADVIAHQMIATPKAFVSLGIVKSDAGIKRLLLVNRIFYAALGAYLAAGIVALAIFLLGR